MLTDYIRETIKSHAQPFPEEEVCGVVVDGDAIRIPNIHPDKANHFELDNSWVNLQPDAIYHSHWKDEQPGELSLEDLEQCKFCGIPYILHHVGFDEWDYYEPKSPNPFPLKKQGDPQTLDFYLNWRFVWGRSDCFALIRSYFLGILGIDIGDFRRPPLDGFPTIGWLTPWKAEEHGFVQVTPGLPLRKHDIIQIALKGGREPNHLGVIVDAEGMQMLHNVSAEYTSQVGLYGSYWQTRTTHIFRHGSLI
ncbi:MAG: hypothetical protein F6J86_07255 [Symploca sp. SIO1B1]|nr:hypothetical protein [Symploca sp. SIO1B1]